MKRFFSFLMILMVLTVFTAANAQNAELEPVVKAGEWTDEMFGGCFGLMTWFYRENPVPDSHSVEFTAPADNGTMTVKWYIGQNNLNYGKYKANLYVNGVLTKNYDFTTQATGETHVDTFENLAKGDVVKVELIHAARGSWAYQCGRNARAACASASYEWYPETGDTTQAALFGTIALFGAAGIVLAKLLKRRTA